MINIVPFSGLTTPAICTALFGFKIYFGPVFQNFTIFSCMSLNRCNKADGAVKMLMVVPVYEITSLFSCIIDRYKSFYRISRAIFNGAEQGFGIGIVIANPGTAI